MRALVVSLAFAVLLAGCTGTDEPLVDTAQTGDTPAPASPATAGAAEGARATEAEGHTAAPLIKHHRATATLGPGAAVCRADASSTFCLSPAGSSTHAYDLDASGTATAFALTLAWETTAPEVEALSFTVIACSEDGCDVFDASGDSPLLLEGMGAWTSLSVAVGPAHRGADAAYARLATGQAITIEGTSTEVS